MRTSIGIILCFFLYYPIFSQSKQKALKNIEAYIKASSEDPNSYELITVYEFFDQQSPEEVEKRLKTDRKVAYSLSMTYSIDDSTYDFTYFHLDKDLNVIGLLRKDAVMELSSEELAAFESFYKLNDKGAAIDSTIKEKQIKLPAKDPERIVCYENDGVVMEYDLKLFYAFLKKTYFSHNIMYRTGHPLVTLAEGIKRNIDKTTAATVSLNKISDDLAMGDGQTYLMLMANDFNAEFMKKGKLRVKNAANGNYATTLIEQNKTVRYPACTRFVLTYTTNEGKQVYSSQMDDYSKKN